MDDLPACPRSPRGCARHGSLSGAFFECADVTSEVLSSGEERFELWRRRAGLVLAAVAFIVVWNLDLALAGAAQHLAAILSAVVVAWVTEVIPMAITAFLGVASAVVLGVAPASEAFAPFADPLIF